MKKIVVFLFISSIYLVNSSFTKSENNEFLPKLNTYCKSLSLNFININAERKAELQDIAKYIIEQRKSGKPANLLFVCTSNSRRSHMAQVWAQVASYYYDIDSVYTFSGGTEQTRVNINAIQALARTGINIYSNNQGDNPLRYIDIGLNIKPWAIFSKKYTDSTNPKFNFAAIMVCTEADNACPFVEGADTRIGMPYQDPKEFDNSPLKDTKYDERCQQIATEMFYLMSIVSKK